MTGTQEEHEGKSAEGEESGTAAAEWNPFALDGARVQSIEVGVWRRRRESIRARAVSITAPAGGWRAS